MRVQTGILSLYGQFLDEILQQEKETENQSLINTNAQILILLNQYDELKRYLTCENEEIEKKQIEIKVRVNHGSFSCNLKPIHIAAMKDDVAAAKILLSTGRCQVNHYDDGKATALYHAAANGNREFIHLLLEHGALEECMEKVKFQDILDQSYPQIELLKNKISFFDEGKIVQINGADFKRMTNATFIDQSLKIDPSEWFYRWINIQHSAKKKYTSWYEISTIDKYHEEMREIYEKFRASPPQKHYLKKNLSSGYTLYAGENIAPFTVIGEYIGEINRELYEEKSLNFRNWRDTLIKNQQVDDDEIKFLYSPNERDHYFIEGREVYCREEGKTKRIEIIDAYEYRNLMPMVDCSFPNVMASKVNTQNGFVKILYLTLENVLKDTLLAFNYGSHSVKRMKYQEMREKELIQFFLIHHDLKSLTALLPNRFEGGSLQERFKQLAAEAPLAYLLSTPTAILLLTLKGILSVEMVEDLFHKNEKIVNGNVVCSNSMEKIFIEELKKLIKNKRINESNKEELLYMIGKEDLLTIFRKMKILNQ